MDILNMRTYRGAGVLTAHRRVVVDLSDGLADIARVRGLHTWDAVVL